MKLLLLVAALVCATYAEWNELMENKGIFEGDMVLDPDEIEEHMKGKIKASYASIKGGRWPNPIKYKIESSIASAGRNAIASAIAQYHKWTCLKFVQDQGARGAHISFYKGSGCSSPVGYRANRMNRISLAAGCWRVGTVMHEIGHSIGLYHEQSRPDRDRYVTIIWNNIQKGVSYNFNKQKTSAIDSLGTHYDYKSMMHYRGTAFGNGKTTIQTIAKNMQRVIGQRSGFSEIDKKQINLMYCGKAACQDTNSNCPNWTTYCRSHSYVKANCRKTCRLC